MRKIAFEYTDLGACFDIELNRRITLIEGQSANGKTFLFESLKKTIRLLAFGEYSSTIFPKPEVNDSKILFINYSDTSKVREILNGCYEDYIICIDNADYILACCPSLSSYIDTDYKNFYIIAARGQLDIMYDTTNEAILDFQDNKFTLKPILLGGFK